MRHACLTLKERLFMPNTLEKLLKKSSVRARLICHVQYAACWLRGLQKPNGQEPTPAASGSPDSARATSPTDRYVKCTSPLCLPEAPGDNRDGEEQEHHATLRPPQEDHSTLLPIVGSAEGRCGLPGAPPRALHIPTTVGHTKPLSTGCSAP